MAINRTPINLIDDDGTGTTGTVLGSTWLTSLLDGADSAYAQMKHITFTETTGAGVYTGTVTLPAGAILIDIIISQVAQWTATTSATMKVGDTGDDDGFYIGINLKTFGAAASADFAHAASVYGAYLQGFTAAGTEFMFGRYLSTSRDIKGIITTVGAAGNAGRTRMTVIWCVPAAGDISAATKV